MDDPNFHNKDHFVFMKVPRMKREQMFVTLVYFKNVLELSDVAIETCSKKYLLYTCGKNL